jgi:flagellar biosynthesis protein
MQEKRDKKIKEAAALKYSPEDGGAPTIVALGRGETAERMLETAKNSDVPVYEDAGLAHTLNALNIGDEIPPELYEVVAQVLVFVSRLDNNYGEKYGYDGKHK